MRRGWGGTSKKGENMPHLEVEGIKVHYRETGSGTPVIFLHGGGSSGAQWRKVCEILGDRYRTITVDHYGHGGTDPWPGSPEDRSHDAEAKLVRAVIGLAGEPVHLAGHSFGGGVSLRLVLHSNAGIRSLAVLEPQAISVLQHANEKAFFEDSRNLCSAFIESVKAGRAEEGWESFIDSNATPGTWRSYPEEVRNKFLATTDPVFSAYYAVMNHPTTLEELKSISLPSLALYGEATSPRLRRLTEIISENIPDCGLGVIAQAGHMSPITHPEGVAEKLESHFRAVENRR